MIIKKILKNKNLHKDKNLFISENSSEKQFKV